MSTNFKLYDDITPAQLDQIASEWDERVLFRRHVATWLMEHGFDWDSGLPDDTNRAKFDRIVNLAYARVSAQGE